MALVSTTNLELGFKAPEFNLPDTLSGNSVDLQEIRSEHATVIMFICNHCPFVKHVINGLIDLANDFIPLGISFVAISSNDVTNYPEDSPEKMKELGTALHFPFPYLYDESQQVAKEYDAACTPDFAIFDKDLLCIYRGQLDDSRPGNNIPVSGEDIRYTLKQVLQGKPVPVHQKPSIGCSIKWK